MDEDTGPGAPPDLQTEFERRYPPERDYRRGLDNNARVWKVYRGEAIETDDGVIQVWDNTINILLTFAGLFSATVTAFAIDAYKLLPPDGRVLPSARAKWVNGLWFTSLFFSLATAFLCILLKQWLDEYRVRTRAPAKNGRHWARRHEFYATGVDKWHLAAYISVLPLLLHVALFLFFAGIVVLLWSLNRELAIFLGSLTGLAFAFYVLSTVSPLVSPACPTATPFLRYLYKGSIKFAIVVLTVIRWLCTRVARRDLWGIHAHGLSRNLSLTHFDRFLARHELDHWDTMPAELDTGALLRMLSTVPEGDASSVACQALGALDARSPLAEMIRRKSSVRGHVAWDLLKRPELSTAASCRIIRSILLVQPDDPLVVTINAGMPSPPTNAQLSIIVRLLSRISLACPDHPPVNPQRPIVSPAMCHDKCLVNRIRATLTDLDASPDVWELAAEFLIRHSRVEARLPASELDVSSPFLTQWVASPQFLAVESHSLPYINRVGALCLDTSWATPARIVISLRTVNQLLRAITRLRVSDEERRAAAMPLVGRLWNHFLTHTPGLGNAGKDHASATNILPGKDTDLTLLSLVTRSISEYKITYPAVHAIALNGDTRSTWGLLAELAPRDGALAQLAYILAPALCTVARLCSDSQPLVDEFLRYVRPRDLFQWIKNYTLQEHHPHLIHSIASHFSELRREWWADAAVMLKDQYEWLDEYLSREEPQRCTACPEFVEKGTMCYFASSISE